MNKFVVKHQGIWQEQCVCSCNMTSQAGMGLKQYKNVTVFNVFETKTMPSERTDQLQNFTELYFFH